MMYTQFDEDGFRDSVERAIQDAQAILGTAKNPRLAEDEDHTYEDKYALADFLTNSSIAALLQVLDRMGLDSQKLPTLLQWVQDDKQTVTLSFRAEESCQFVKETIVETPSHRHVVQSQATTETTTASDGNETPSTTTTSTTKSFEVVHKVKQHHWKVDLNYAIAVYPGTDASAAVQLQARSASTDITTSGGMANVGEAPVPPLKEHTVHPPVEVNITWLLQQLNREAGVCQFAIDRRSERCKTPFRNPNVQAAVEFNYKFQEWATGVQLFFTHHVDQDILAQHTPNVAQGETTNKNPLHMAHNGADQLSHPILPLMENGSVLEAADTRKVLEAHSQSLNESVLDLAKLYPAPSQHSELATSAEALLVLLCYHATMLARQYMVCAQYIEHMLFRQLVQAIGKSVGSADFDKFMRFHQQRLFGALYRPKPFTYAIRRPNHYPDGILAIEPADGVEDSIETMVRHVPGNDNPPIYMPINAATSLELTGDRFLHGWVQHRFASEPTPKFRLAARARQFSSFLLVLGNMAGKDKFAPKSAIILQNKDEVLIPLLTEVLPSAKEFKDAIASLSPEQQAFAKAYRGMQLESSVFGVCVIQLKPQLETLLGLPSGSLTKEIKLTQDLMSLFVDHQIPSDLLSFDGDSGATTTTQKLDAVKGHVKAVLDVVDTCKKEQLLEEERKKEMARATALQASPLQALPAGAMFGSAPAYSPSANAYSPAYSSFGGGGAMTIEPSFDGFGAAMEESRSAQTKGTVLATSGMKLGVGGAKRHRKKAGGSATSTGSSQPLMPAKASEPRKDPMDTDPRNNETGDVDFNESDDFTLIPKVLDARIETLDAEGALKSTVLTAGNEWVRMRQDNLLAKRKKQSLFADEISDETNQAFDLLDALSRSGTLSIDCSELHVIVALSHCFENDVMTTLVEDNVNPIAKAERSSLIVGSVIHDEPCQVLVQGESNAGRLGASFPALFADTD